MRRFLLTGCSGGGKSTVLNALAAYGYVTVAEPGRKIVQSQNAINGNALPWADKTAFGMLLLDATLAALAQRQTGTVLYDRGLPDVAAWFEQIGEPFPDRLLQAMAQPLYSNPIFLAPPWPEIYRQDEERPKPFEEALAEYIMIERQLDLLGLPVLVLPKIDVDARTAFIISNLP